MRLDKFLVHMGIGSRKEVKSCIKKKRVKVNGHIVIKPEMNIDENTDEIMLDDEVIHYTEYYYIMLNKPGGYLSATTDTSQPTVLDLIDGYEHVDLFPIGRLDKDTEGLMILTNDGQLAHYLLSPKHHIEKVYYALLDKDVEEEDYIAFSEGIKLKDFTTMPAKLERIGEKEVYVSIHEGKFHQIKRMFASRGKEVVYLKRIKMGNIELDYGLSLGEYRLLTQEEIDFLKGST